MNRYLLLKPHTFNRELKVAGETVLLPAQTGDWLVEQGVLELLRLPEPVSAPAEVPKLFAAKPRRRAVAPIAQPGRSCCGWSQ